MAKQQSKLRDAIDIVFAPSDYLESDGTALSYGRVGKAINTITRPEFMVGGAAGVFHCSLASDKQAALIVSVVGLCLLQAVKLGFDEIMIKAIKDKYFDTQRDTLSFVKPQTALSLNNVKEAAKFWSVASIPGLGIQLGYAASGDVGLFTSFSLAAGATTLCFGHFWRAKQVLDGNWTILDEKPPNCNVQDDLKLQPLS